MKIEQQSEVDKFFAELPQEVKQTQDIFDDKKVTEPEKEEVAKLKKEVSSSNSSSGGRTKSSC